MKKGVAEQINELSEMISGKTYTEKYMYGISYLKTIIELYETRFRQECGSSPVQMVDFRIKSAESVADKLEKKGYGISLENAERYLSDLAGIRVICFSEEDVYALDRFLCKREEITIVKRKDYIKVPKANGYRSLHLITELNDPADSKKIRVEIQIRTQAMHCWAETDHRQFYKKLTK